MCMQRFSIFEFELVLLGTSSITWPHAPPLYLFLPILTHTSRCSSKLCCCYAPFFLSVNLWASSDKFQTWKAFRECRLDYNKRHLITNTTTHFQNQRKNLKLTKEDRELETLYKCHIRWHKEIPSSRSLTRKDTWKRVHFWRPQVVRKYSIFWPKISIKILPLQIISTGFFFWNRNAKLLWESTSKQ